MNKIQPGRKTRFKMPLRYLIEPETWAPTPRFQQLLEMYRWMAQTADVPRYQGKSGWRGGYPGCQQLLNGGESSIGPILIRPFTGDWAKDLQQRFLHVLMSRHASPPVTLWRKDFDIQIDAVKWVQAPWFECWPREQHLPWLTYHERNWQYEGELLKRLLSIREDGPESESLVWQLNAEHAGAVAVHGVRLNLVHDYRKPGPYPLIWSFDVLIGYPKDRSSWWNYTLALQSDGELLIDLMARAWLRLRALQGKSHEKVLEPQDGLELVQYDRDTFNALEWRIRYDIRKRTHTDSYGHDTFTALLKPKELQAVRSES